MTWADLFRPEVLAAFLSAIATALAAYATWAGPTAAARMAEELRRKSEATNERRRAKLNVFATIMQERAAIYSVQSVQALNLIDVVFHDVPSVREAWAELFLTFSDGSPQQLREERIRRMLKAMAEDVGLAGNLRLDDLGRIYYPTALANEDEVRRTEISRRLEHLKAPPASNVASPVGATSPSPFPPPPTS